MVQWKGRQLQQCPVDFREQVEAYKDFLVIHCIQSISRHLDLVLPLDIGGLRQDSESMVHLFLTLNRVIVQVTSHPSSLYPIISKSGGDRYTTKQQVWVHWQS